MKRKQQQSAAILAKSIKVKFKVSRQLHSTASRKRLRHENRVCGMVVVIILEMPVMVMLIMESLCVLEQDPREQKASCPCKS